MRHFHQPAGSSDSTDPATWVAASYQSHPVDFLEPIDLEPNGYRQAAIRYLGIMFAVDEFITAAQDARLATIAIAVTLQWPSVRGLTIATS
jgi:hypothetical protein